MWYQNIIFGIKKKDKKNKQSQIKNLVENLNICTSFGKAHSRTKWRRNAKRYL